jgi:hypothetical protein
MCNNEQELIYGKSRTFCTMTKPDEESLGSTTFHSISNECSYIRTWKQREMCLKVELIWDRLLNVVLLTVPPTPTVRLWSLQLPRPMDLKDESDKPQPIITSSNWKLCPSHWSSKLFVAIWVQPLVLRTFNLEFFAVMCVRALPDTCSVQSNHEYPQGGWRCSLGWRKAINNEFQMLWKVTCSSSLKGPTAALSKQQDSFSIIQKHPALQALENTWDHRENSTTTL